MVVYNAYVYDRLGACQSYVEWQRSHNSMPHDSAEERRLVYGALYSVRAMTSSFSPAKGALATEAQAPSLLPDGPARAASPAPPAPPAAADAPPPAPGPPGAAADAFLVVRTAVAAQHSLVTPSGLHFVLHTDKAAPACKEPLEHAFDLWVRHVVRNPNFGADRSSGVAAFEGALGEYLRSLALWER